MIWADRANQDLDELTENVFRLSRSGIIKALTLRVS
jgi:hypothetical protein